MSLTRKLEQLELGLLQPCAFRESVRLERVESLCPSLYREVVCSWNSQRERLAGFIDDGGLSCGYLSIDIDKTESRYLLAGCTDGSLEIFDLDPISHSPKQRCPRIAAVKRESPDCHKSNCNWVQWYSRDNGIFVTSSHDKNVSVWDANEMAVVESFSFNMPVFMHHLAGEAANGVAHNLIAVASDESNVRLADMRTGAQTQHLYGHHKQGVTCVQWSPYDSNVLLSAGRDGRLLSWDIRSGKSFLKALQGTHSRDQDDVAHKQGIVGLRFAPPKECLRLISLDTEGDLQIWDALTLELVMRTAIRFRSNPRSLKAVGVDFACHNFQNREKNYLFIPTGTNVDMVSLSDGRIFRTLSAHMMPCYSCAYRGSDYQELYTASYDRTIGCFRPNGDENTEFSPAVQAAKHAAVDMTQDAWSDSD